MSIRSYFHDQICIATCRLHLYILLMELITDIFKVCTMNSFKELIQIYSVNFSSIDPLMFHIKIVNESIIIFFITLLELSWVCGCNRKTCTYPVQNYNFKYKSELKTQALNVWVPLAYLSSTVRYVIHTLKSVKSIWQT